jgi:ABC-type multidrug transport system fused ATPase/permease subunit
MQNTGLLRQFLGTQRRAFRLVLGLELLGSILTLLLPLLVAQAFAEVFEFQSMRGRLLQKMGLNFQPNFLLLLGLAILAKLGFDYYRRYIKGLFMERFLTWLRQKLFTQHLRMQVQEYEKTGTSKYLMRFSGDLGSAQQLLNKGVFQFFADASLLVLGVLLLFWLNVQLGGLILGLSLLAAWAVRGFNRRIEQLEEQRRDRKSGLLSFVNQRLFNILSIKALNRETPEQQLFVKRTQKIQALGDQYQQQVAMLNALIPFFIYLLLLVVLGVAYVWKKQGVIFPQDTLFALILVLLTWKPVLNRVMQIGVVWKKGGISLRKIGVLLAKPLEPAGVDQERDWKAALVKVDLPETPVHPALQFQLQKGVQLHLRLTENVQFTLIKYLAALESLPEESIHLDDVAIETLSPKSIRRQFTFVSPLFPLYGKNVLEAISYSRKHQAKAAAMLAEWQLLFPELSTIHSETPVTERRVLTSAQLQLLQWLRAFLTNKPFWVLQNPFGGLSANNCQQLQALLAQKKSQTGVLYLIDQPQFEDNFKKKDAALVTFHSSTDM